jgi:hypothetical protein
MPRTIRVVSAALAALAIAAPAASAARIDDPVPASDVVATSSAPAQDLRSPEARDSEFQMPNRVRAGAARPKTSSDVTAALAQGRYYSSYGEPEPIRGPAAPAPANGIPWLTIALAATIALVAASIAAILRRRLRLRRHVVGAAT